MAPTKKPLRTYSRGNNSSISCMEALDILFAKNKTVTKLAKGQKGLGKAKKKIQIRELPQKIKSFLANESSLHVNFDDTFDKLKGAQCNVVKGKDIVLKKLKSYGHNSKNKPLVKKITHFNSPIYKRTRSHASSAEISEIMNGTSKRDELREPGKDTLDSFQARLEIRFQTKKKAVPLNETSTNSSILVQSNSSKSIIEPNIKVNGASTPLNNMKHPRKPSRFILNGSIRNSPILLRSRGKTPEVSFDSIKHNGLPNIILTEASNTVNQTQSENRNESANIENLNQTFFTHSVSEKILVHCSTPLVPNDKRKLIKQPVSPIKTGFYTRKDKDVIKFPSGNELVQEAIEESFEEIKNWNRTFPKIVDQIDDSYQLNLDKFAGSNIQEQLFNMDKFLREKRQNSVSVKHSRKYLPPNVCSGKSKRKKLLEKLASKSYSLEDFEKFHSVLSSSDSSNSSSSKSFSLKDFETFHKKLSLAQNSFTTKRKSKIEFKKHIQHLHKKFGLKNLCVELDDIVNNKIKVNGKTTKLFTSKTFIKILTVKQPVINLTRLSLNSLKQVEDKNCLENTQSSNNDELQKDSHKNNVQELEVPNKESSNQINKAADTLNAENDTNVIDLTDENIEIPKKNSLINIISNIDINCRNKKSKGNLTRSQSTPITQKHNNSITAKRSLIAAENNDVIDLTCNEIAVSLANNNISKGQESAEVYHEAESNTDIVDLTDDNIDQNLTNENVNQCAAVEDDVVEILDLEDDIIDDALADSEDPEKTKSDLEELFGIASSNASKNNEVLPTNNHETLDTILDKSPIEFYGFTSVSEPVVLVSAQRSSKNNSSKKVLNNQSKSLNAQELVLINDKRKVSGTKVDCKKSKNNNSKLTNNMSLEDILNDMLSRNIICKKVSTEQYKETDKKKKYSLRSKYESNQKENNNKIINNHLRPKQKEVNGPKHNSNNAENSANDCNQILSDIVYSSHLQDVSVQNNNENGIEKINPLKKKTANSSKQKEDGITLKRKKYALRIRPDAKERLNYNDESRFSNCSDNPADISSIFFASLQLLPNNNRTRLISLSSEKDERNSFTETTLPDICDPKNLEVNITNRRLSEVIVVLDDNEIDDLISRNPQNPELVVNVTLRDFEEETNGNTKNNSTINVLGGAPVSDRQDKRVPINLSRDLLVDLTPTNFSLEILDPSKTLQQLDSGNIVVADPMEEELEISCTSSKNFVKVRRSIDGFSKDNSVPSSEVSSSNESCDVIESSLNSTQDTFKVPVTLKDWSKQRVTLKAGKSWRRSLSTYQKRSGLDLSSDSTTDFGTSSLQNSTMLPRLSDRRQSIKIVPVRSNVTSRKTSILESYALHTVLDESEVDISSDSPLRKSTPTVSARDIVLKKCGQTIPLPFTQLYSPSLLKDCKKIGEGVYGEVFLYKKPNGQSTVMKVIPIEGSLVVNGERQKRFDEILSEIVISSELSNLRTRTSTCTAAFCEVQRICCVKGTYPDRLLDLWDQYDEEKGSENESPEVFTKEQLYIVLDLANAGQDLEAFVFTNASQACSMIQQVACGLACAEDQLKFEHRDLHWGNVLLRAVDKKKKVTCKIGNKEIVTQTKGVEATIIDFTLSRMSTDGVVMFNDLSKDPDLFLGDGDYQFDIYRKMKDKNENDWERFEPYTNILWLHYVLDKSITALRYKNTNTKIHSTYLEELNNIKESILRYSSVTEFVSSYYC